MAKFTFCNSTKTSAEIRRSYIANIRFHSQSAFIIDGFCQITVSIQLNLLAYLAWNTNSHSSKIYSYYSSTI